MSHTNILISGSTNKTIIHGVELCEKIIKGDGNCLYRSVAASEANKDNYTHQELRDMTSKEIADNSEVYEQKRTDEERKKESIGDFSKRVGKDKEIAGHLEIGALARVLGCSFYVDDVEEKVLHPLQLPQDEDQQAIAVYLRLRHSGSNTLCHYNLLDNS